MLTDRDRIKLADCHPTLIERIDKVLVAMQAIGYTMAVTDGVRTTAQQQALYAKGRTAPGPIVTNANGVTSRSNHQTHGDGYGHAADCAFVINGRFSWDARLPWKAYGALGEALGLRWGGAFVSLHDLPHLELP
jgi:peptidoglycan LD-endopeptidase CwlK